MLEDGTLVIDCDSHWSEPADLFTSRAPEKFRDRVPQVATVDGEPSWVFDGQVVLWNHFGGDGSWVGEEQADDPNLAKSCAASFDAAWKRAIPHEDYRPA